MVLAIRLCMQHADLSSSTYTIIDRMYIVYLHVAYEFIL